MANKKPTTGALALALLPTLVGSYREPVKPTPEAARTLLATAFAWAEQILEAWPKSPYTLKNVS